MLIGAEIIEATVDDDGAMAVCVNPKNLRKQDGEWVSDGHFQIVRGEIASFLCRGIPNGESRVIDLEKSVIVHMQPKKTAVKELVEKWNEVRLRMHPDANFTTISRTEIEKIDTALARVRQEMKV